jgi:hypothetical protein
LQHHGARRSRLLDRTATLSGVGSIATTDADVGEVTYMAHIAGLIACVLMAFVFRVGRNKPTASSIIADCTAPHANFRHWLEDA